MPSVPCRPPPHRLADAPAARCADDNLLHPPSLLRLDQRDASHCGCGGRGTGGSGAAQRRMAGAEEQLPRCLPAPLTHLLQPTATGAACICAWELLLRCAQGGMGQWEAAESDRGCRLLTPVARRRLQQLHEHCTPRLLRRFCGLRRLLLLLRRRRRLRGGRGQHGQHVLNPSCPGPQRSTAVPTATLRVATLGPRPALTLLPYCWPMSSCMRRCRMASSSGSCWGDGRGAGGVPRAGGRAGGHCLLCRRKLPVRRWRRGRD